MAQEDSTPNNIKQRWYQRLKKKSKRTLGENVKTSNSYRTRQFLHFWHTACTKQRSNAILLNICNFVVVCLFVCLLAFELFLLLLLLLLAGCLAVFSPFVCLDFEVFLCLFVCLLVCMYVCSH